MSVELAFEDKLLLLEPGSLHTKVGRVFVVPSEEIELRFWRCDPYTFSGIDTVKGVISVDDNEVIVTGKDEHSVTLANSCKL
jgi:hypothetical protein